MHDSHTSLHQVLAVTLKQKVEKLSLSILQIDVSDYYFLN